MAATPSARCSTRTCWATPAWTTGSSARTSAASSDPLAATGDVPAMWPGDSSVKVWPYLPSCRDDHDLRALIAGVINRQARCILLDPYANAFNDGATGGPWQKCHTAMRPELHERKW